MRRAFLLSLAAAGALSACRDVPQAIVAPERTPAALTYPLQLTYSVRNDRTPGWTPDGDSVYYVRHGDPVLGVPTTQTYSIPATAGFAEPRLVQLHNDTLPVLLYSPRISPVSRRLAIAQVTLYHPERVSQGNPVCEGDASAMQDANASPRLGAITLRVREEAAATMKSAEVELRGRYFDPTPFRLLDGSIVVHYYPFQRLWDQDRTIPFHLSWAPDGNRLITSNGIELVVWDVTGGQPQVLVGSVDAVSPAWSPDGARVAYTRVARADSASAFCVYPTLGLPLAYQFRTVYTVGARRLVMLDLATGATTDLGEGIEPAWSRDGSYLVARRGTSLWRIPADGSAATFIPGTEGAREPSVSPDGSRIAFARLSDRGDYDIWITSLAE